jgi:hypothetical protein
LLECESALLGNELRFSFHPDLRQIKARQPEEGRQKSQKCHQQPHLIHRSAGDKIMSFGHIHFIERSIGITAIVQHHISWKSHPQEIHPRDLSIGSPQPFNGRCQRVSVDDRRAN